LALQIQGKSGKNDGKRNSFHTANRLRKVKHDRLKYASGMLNSF
jgi:hypothetical protein